MEIKSIRAWLKNSKRSQAWLADAVGVDVVTVNRWLTERAAISLPCQKLIARLMEEGEGKPCAYSSPSASLTDEQIDTAAQSIGKSSKELIRGVLYHVSDKITDAATSEEKEH